MIELTARPKTIDEVVIKKDQVASGIVNIPMESEGLVFGTVLTSTDGGDTWNSQERDLWVAGDYEADAEVFHNGHSWKALADNSVEPVDGSDWQDLGAFDANGVLGETITETSNVSVIVTGFLREKHLSAYDASMKPSLFKNKIILR